MNTLDDLRATLAREAGAAPHGHHPELAAAARARAGAVRRQRRAGVALAAAVAVGTAGVAAWLPGRSDAPVADTVFGIDVPETMTSLGWTYVHDGSIVESDSGVVAITLQPSDTPRLVSWATRGDDDRVEVRQGGRDTAYASSAADFRDFVLVHQGEAVTVTVRARDAGVALATYAVDPDRAPEGVGEGISRFRTDVVGRDFLVAGQGEPGQASVEVSLVAPSERSMAVAVTCADAPRGAVVHLGIVGEQGSMQFGRCEGEEFDPAGNISTTFEPGELAGREIRLRAWLTDRSGRVLADADAPDVRLGLGVYAEEPPGVASGQLDFPLLTEAAGHVWEVEESRNEPDGEVAVDVPSDGTFMVMGGAQGPAAMVLAADGRRFGGDFSFGTAGSFGAVPVPPGATEVTLDAEALRSGGAAPMATLVLYRKVY